MPSANVIRQVKRWVALTFFIGLHVMCVWVVLTNTIAAFLRNSPLVGLVATLLFVALVSLASMTLTATVRKEAGIPVWWHSCTSIEALVRGVVTECVETNSGANHANASNGGTLRDDHEEDVTRKANEAASRVLEFERQVAAQPMQDVVVRPKAKNSLEYDDVNDYEDTSAVRGLKNHLGLDVVTMGDVARAALERLNSHDGSVMGEEVSYLLDGAKCCKICNVYKLDGTHHCSSCGHCVAQMDHHCTWIGQCIGRENHKYFLLYLGYMTLLTSYTSILTASALAKEWIYFAQAGMEPKPMSLMVFMLCISFAVVLIPFTIQSVADAGCGDSLIMIFQRERRQQVEREAQRAATPATGESGVRVYAPLFQEGAEDTEAAVAARQNVSSFSVENLQRVFGIGRRLPDWLLPMPPMWPPEHGAMEEAQRRLKELVRHQLEAATDAGHSTAVSVPVRVPE